MGNYIELHPCNGRIRPPLGYGRLLDLLTGGSVANELYSKLSPLLVYVWPSTTVWQHIAGSLTCCTGALPPPTCRQQSWSGLLLVDHHIWARISSVGVKVLPRVGDQGQGRNTQLCDWEHASYSQRMLGCQTMECNANSLAPTRDTAHACPTETSSWLGGKRQRTIQIGSIPVFGWSTRGLLLACNWSAQVL